MCFSQIKKEEGPSCAWTDAAAHSKQSSDNVAARNILIGNASPKQATVAVPTKEST